MADTAPLSPVDTRHTLALADIVSHSRHHDNAPSTPIHMARHLDYPRDITDPFTPLPQTFGDSVPRATHTVPRPSTTTHHATTHTSPIIIFISSTAA